ncbi:DUF262 domain-containing protein [Brevundimonas subvibrioides]|uniref:DUF262 domain-containing protein n=1 Tax=Brevundimonas subvibrioides (strain ATCC 15264 / DSM 4735 / LMG 14903 / NBRC 16000 / CB 81) TaxID=633149 RepID=D9QIL6_BRESC|nr:DUF262 domain-containing protein [Brevundimonas subvibrioides]ADL01349.1 protein of unknown function DUF262 [Brevundimonas subvibrioides ATCC 15264]
MQLSPLHLSVAKLLDGRLFRIPGYQRAYSWQSRQRADLFKDIEEAHRSGREHFMATVVALAREKRVIAADELQVVELVDGQQRVTSLVILIKAIEKALGETDGAERKSKRDLQDLLVKGDDHSLVLLQTNHDSSDVFLNYLRKGELTGSVATGSDQNLLNAMRESEEVVARWQAAGELVALLGTIRNKLSLIYHELLDEATVYRVFEVLNSRGLDVRWIDKTKSQLMASICEYVDDPASRAEGLREMQTIWQDIYRILGLREGLGTESLRLAGTWSALNQPNRIVSDEDASRELVRRAGEKLPSIIEAAQWLRQVVREVNELNGDVRLSAVTKIAHARMLAIAIKLRKFDPATQEGLLGAWEKVTFRIFGLAGRDTRHMVGDYVRLGFDILARKMTSTDIAKALANLGEGFEIDEIIDDGDWSECYGGWSEELRYLLFRYDERLAKDAGEQINAAQWTKIWSMDASKSIEHIVPQSSDKRYIHHLGNLTMLPPGVNSSLKDKPPAKKSDRYIECGIKETVAVGRLVQERRGWTEQDVHQRAQRLLEFVRTEWG